MARLLRSSAVLLAIAAIAATAAAQAPATALAAGDAQEYLGGWKIAMDFMGQELEMSIEFLDEDGLLVALLRSPQGEQRITDIVPGDEGLRLLFESQFGEMSIDARLDSDELLGIFRIPGASIEADFRCVRGAGSAVTRGRELVVERRSPSVGVE